MKQVDAAVERIAEYLFNALDRSSLISWEGMGDDPRYTKDKAVWRKHARKVVQLSKENQ